MKFVCAILFLLVITFPLIAQTNEEEKSGGTVELFANWCGDLKPGEKWTVKEWTHRGFCQGYFSGIWFAARNFDYEVRNGFIEQKIGTVFFCPPEGGSPNQLKKIFLKWANDHPERLHEEKDSVIFEVLRDAFPCSKQNMPNGKTATP
jgi:hypothetical protein